MKTAATTALLAGMMLGAGGLSTPAFAGNNGHSQSSQSSQSSSMQRSHQKNAGGQVSGQITAVKTITFNNGNDYVLAKVKDSQGHTIVLNLGRAKNLKDQNVNLDGQYIRASGRSGRLNDKPILVVYSFSTSGNSYFK